MKDDLSHHKEPLFPTAKTNPASFKKSDGVNSKGPRFRKPRFEEQRFLEILEKLVQGRETYLLKVVAHTGGWDLE